MRNYLLPFMIMLSSAHAYRLVGNALRMHSRRKFSALVCPNVQPVRSNNFTSVSFFRFVEIKDEEVSSIVSLAKESLQRKNIKGTLLVSNEGYNGQFALAQGSVQSFCSDLETIDHKIFGNLDVNIGNTIDYDETNTVFPFKKLIVRRKKGALTDGLAEEIANTIDWTQPGPEMPPDEWHSTVTGSSVEKPVVLLDCRNSYESDLGLFEGATLLNTSYFSETWDKLDEVLEGVEKDAKILTYCTGGIRCVKVNAYLQQKMGFTNTHRLQGGIIAYDQWVAQQQEQEQQFTSNGESEPTMQPTHIAVASCFKGQNFLFDRRRLNNVPSHTELNKNKSPRVV